MSKIIKSQYENDPIKIMGEEIPCAVLEDDLRVVSLRGMTKALEREWGGRYSGGRNLPRFISPKVLNPFIKPKLRGQISNPIKYTTLRGGTIAHGILAELLDDICQVWVDASDAGVLTEKQEKTAQKARILQRATAKIGWVALVDEATGFQKVRDKKALEGLLKLYISKEFLPWVKTFIEAFYEEIYRLKGWHYNPKKNKYQVVGKYTLKYVYGCLPKPIVDRVREKTLRGKSGNYTKKLFQSLTREVGKPHLDRALGGVIALMKASPTWRIFQGNYARAYGDQKDQLELPLGLLEEE